MVLPEEREAAFRGVVGSDKFGARPSKQAETNGALQQSAQDSENEGDEETNSDEEEDPRLAEEKA